MTEAENFELFENRALDAFSDFLQIFGFKYDKKIGRESSSKFIHRFKKGTHFIDIIGRLKGQNMPDIDVILGDRAIIDGRRNSIALFDLSRMPDKWKRLIRGKFEQGTDDKSVIRAAIKRLKIFATDFLNGHTYYFDRAISGDFKEKTFFQNTRRNFGPLFILFIISYSIYYFYDIQTNKEKQEKLDNLITEFKEIERDLIKSKDKVVSKIKGEEANKVDLSKMSDKQKFFYFTRQGMLMEVAEMVQKGINPESIKGDKQGATPLHAAVASGNQDLIKFFIKYGISINSIDKYGRTPLHMAAYYGDTQIIKLLAENGADMNVRDITDETPILMTVTKETIPPPDVIDTLISLGADPRMSNNAGLNLLDKALEYNHEVFAKYLIKNYGKFFGIDMNSGGSAPSQ